MDDSTHANQQFRDKLSETRVNIADMGHIAKEAIQDKYAEIKDLAGERFAAGKQGLRDAEADVANRIRHSPLQSVLVAAGLGLAVGLLLRRL